MYTDNQVDSLLPFSEYHLLHPQSTVKNWQMESLHKKLSSPALRPRSLSPREKRLIFYENYGSQVEYRVRDWILAYLSRVHRKYDRVLQVLLHPSLAPFSPLGDHYQIRMHKAHAQIP